MREREFERWFGTVKNMYGRPYTEGNLGFYVRAARDIERAEGVNLDKEFQKDGMESLLELYCYSKDDKENNRPNPTSLNVKASRIPDFKTALNHYHRFCKNNPSK